MHANHRMRASDDRRRPELGALCGLCLFHNTARARKQASRLRIYATPGRGVAETPKGSCSQPPPPSAAGPS